ncbi:TonB-dependent receptor [Aquisalinus flavus]|uniref:TonB-dependent receptor n=1 Tax=Aquisalinus flavus TaxID=1526572 RepID=A0A8J2V7D7_9PROT|nr:TonB-dependent receptor [Aquisalinus flavus]MBD0425189.1 TonB-dependent receptor [Aquisalinus flavus]UNE49147.1 TonB-dependent receptor [Aquisalinus flavus]GGD18057.1 hypothetical protein GCM10011342_28580 [Aquisalinus flavus]
MFIDLPPQPVLYAQSDVQVEADNQPVDQIVITAKRRTAPKVEDFESVVSLGQQEIDLFAFDTVAEAVEEALSLANATGQRITLVNGKPGMNPRVFNKFPAEAIEKIDVLPPEAAGPLGYPANATVINIVLKEKYHALTINAGVTVPSNGLNTEGEGDFSDARTRGSRLLLIDGEVNATTGFTEAEALDCGSADASPDCADDAAFRSALAETTNYELGVAVSDFVGQYAVSGFVRATQEETTDRLGLTVPESGDGLPIVRDADSNSLSAGLNVVREFNEIRLTGESEISRSEDSGVTKDDIAPQAEYERETTTLSSSLELAMPVFNIPAGQVRATGKVSYANRETETASGGGDNSSISNETTGADAGLYIPLTKQDEDRGAWGSSGLNLRAFGTQESNSDGSSGAEATLRLRPSDKYSISIKASSEDSAPDFKLLDDATRESPNSRFYDYETGETVLVTTIIGGNAALVPEKKDTVEVELVFTPKQDRSLFARIRYNSERSENLVQETLPIGPFTEDAFPDRFVRDDMNQLISVDRSPVNIAEGRTDSLQTFAMVRKVIRDEEAGPGGPGGRGGGRGDWNALPDSGKLLRAFVYHTWTMTNELKLNDGQSFLPAVLVEGGAADPEHRAGLNLRAANSTLAGNMGLYWQSSRDGTQGGAVNGLRYASFTSLNAGLDIDLEKPLGDTFKSTRLTLEANNLLDERGAVTDANGDVPPGFDPKLRSPIARTFTVKLRRQF